MKVANVTLPLTAMLLLSGSGQALASGASALDPYAYIQAPTHSEREQQQKKSKKFKLKHLRAAKEKEPSIIDEPVAKAAPKPATVIIGSDSAKDEGKVKGKQDNKLQTAKTASSDQGGGFLDGIKQSTDGIAKSTKAVGSKIAESIKSAGEKVKDGTTAAGEKMASTGAKVKEGSSSVSEKVANKFKSAGGSLAALPKAVGSAAGRVSNSTQGGAKKLAAAPAAGLGAIGHGISKMNPFHKDAAPVAVAQKAKDGAAKTEVGRTDSTKSNGTKTELAKSNSAKTAASKAELATSPEQNTNKTTESETEKTALNENDIEAGDKTADANSGKNAADKTSDLADKSPAVPVDAKNEKVASAADKDAKTSAKSLETANQNQTAQADGGLKKKIASAPLAGLEATKAGIGAIGHGFTKFNPFHKSTKTEEPAATTAQKPTAEQATPKQEATPASGPQTQLGERIQPESETKGQSIAAPEAKPGQVNNPL